MKNKIVMLTAACLLTSGCASVMSGTDQDIAMHTNPEGAECILTREGVELRKVTTPETINVSKLKHDIYVTCSKEGFHDSTAHVNSGTQGSTFGNILLGGGIGWAIDSARGADNKYSDVVTVTMVPSNQVAPEVVMIGVDGKPLTQEEVDAMKAAEAAQKKEQAEAATEGAPSMGEPADAADTTDALAPENSVESLEGEASQDQ